MLFEDKSCRSTYLKAFKLWKIVFLAGAKKVGGVRDREIGHHAETILKEEQLKNFNSFTAFFSWDLQLLLCIICICIILFQSYILFLFLQYTWKKEKSWNATEVVHISGSCLGSWCPNDLCEVMLGIFTSRRKKGDVHFITLFIK